MPIGIGLGLGFGSVRTTTSYSFTNTEAQTYVAAMPVAPDNTRKGLIDTLVGSLKTAGVWTKLDFLYLLGAHDADAALINAVSPGTYNALAVNSPSFTVDRGYTTDATTSYLNSQLNPTTAGSLTKLFAQNSCHMGVWSRTAASGLYDIGQLEGTSGANIAILASGNFYAYGHTNAVPGDVNASAVGHYAWSRTGATAWSKYKNGASVSAQASASTALNVNSSARIYIGGYWNGTLVNGSARQYFAAHLGSGLTGTELTALYNALDAYRSGVGA